MPLIAKSLIKAGEEGAELAQACLKATYHRDEYFEVNNNPLFEKIIEEFGDSLAANEFALQNASPFLRKRVLERMANKLAIFHSKAAKGAGVA